MKKFFHDLFNNFLIYSFSGTYGTTEFVWHNTVKVGIDGLNFISVVTLPQINLKNFKFLAN